MAGKKVADESDESGGRLRSPAHPIVDLKVALEKADEFYRLERRNAANPSVVLKHWGYEPKNSKAARVLAALKQFGLMRETGEKVQISDLALRILLDKRQDSPERQAAIREAALRPKIHASLKAEWPETLPTDENLRHDLIFRWKFNENHVDKFIRQYRATLAFAKLDSDGSLVQPDGNTDSAGADQEMQQQGQFDPDQKPLGFSKERARHGFSKVPIEGEPTRDLVIPLMDGQIALLRLPVVMTKENYQFLTDHIKMWERAFVQDSKKGAED